MLLLSFPACNDKTAIRCAAASAVVPAATVIRNTRRLLLLMGSSFLCGVAKPSAKLAIGPFIMAPTGLHDQPDCENPQQAAAFSSRSFMQSENHSRRPPRNRHAGTMQRPAIAMTENAP